MWLFEYFCKLENLAETPTTSGNVDSSNPAQVDLPSPKITKTSHLEEGKYKDSFLKHECETRYMIGISSVIVLLITILVIVSVRGWKANKWVKVQLFLVFLSNLFGYIFSLSLSESYDTIYQDGWTFFLQMVVILTYLSSGMLSTWHFVY